MKQACFCGVLVLSPFSTKRRIEKKTIFARLPMGWVIRTIEVRAARAQVRPRQTGFRFPAELITLQLSVRRSELLSGIRYVRSFVEEAEQRREQDLRMIALCPIRMGVVDND